MEVEPRTMRRNIHEKHEYQRYTEKTKRNTMGWNSRSLLAVALFLFGIVPAAGNPVLGNEPEAKASLCRTRDWYDLSQTIRTPPGIGSSKASTAATAGLTKQIHAPILGIPRGGSGSLGRSGGPQQIIVHKQRIKRGVRRNNSYYLKALDDEILRLEQQLRRVHEEKRTLIKRARAKAKRKPKATSKTKPASNNSNNNNNNNNEQKQEAEDEEQLLRLANLERLENERDALLRARDQLESLKADCEEKQRALESELTKEGAKRREKERSLRKKVGELEATIRKTTRAGATVGGNSPELDEAIRAACQAAIEGFWAHATERLRQHEADLRVRHNQELEDEQNFAKAALKKQKEKMRALARAMAVREQELWEKRKGESLSTKGRKREEPSGPKARARARAPDEKEREKDETLRLRAIREEAERKSREEEERLWLELERGLKEEREQLERQKKREEEERRLCEREERERQRILQMHAMEEKRQQEEHQHQQEQAPPGPEPSRGFWASLRRRRSAPSSEGRPCEKPLPSPIENYRHRVPWQPVFLPPKELVRLTTPAAALDP
ncbi:unnamed protein product [Pseudo-nitzschia multistriata]|uniref:Trichohyalin n=1 Tax=Pseudo-nitzschia multistriata TaxID=183589 RepID=A0A448Z3K7_9STRA|nr:unnamed protein product [Pseudo-nitzschia multistriata]